MGNGGTRGPLLHPCHETPTSASPAPPKPCHASVANYIQYRAKKGGEGLSSLRRSLQTSSVTYIAITRRSYLVVGHPESLAILRDIRQFHPQVFVLPDPIAVKAAHQNLQIVIGVVASPCRGYHHHVDWVRWVKLGERFMTPPFDEGVAQRVGDSGIHHQRDDRDGNDRIPPCRRLAVPSHGCDRLIATQRDLCLGRKSAWVRRKCGSEELECG